MAVGQGALIGGDSYLAIGRESTYGTAVTCTAGLEFISASLKATKENKIIEQIERSRTFSKRISLSKSISGNVDFYFAPLITAGAYLLQNAFGGTVTSATATGETAGGGAFTHTFEVGSMDQAYPSLSANLRKGGSSGEIFQYNGLRVGEMGFSAEIDDALKCSVSLVGQDVTAGSSVASLLTVTSAPVLSFVDGRLSVETSFNSLTSTSFWHVQAFELAINNNLNSDSGARRIGSDVLSVLPPGMMNIELKATVRFDTTTAFDAMMAATQLSAQLEILGPTMSGSAVRQGIKFNMPRVYITDAGDPEISDANGILTSEVTFHVVRDDTTSTGYALKALLTNNASSV